jgi:hypothetical protein
MVIIQIFLKRKLWTSVKTSFLNGMVKYWRDQSTWTEESELVPIVGIGDTSLLDQPILDNEIEFLKALPLLYDYDRAFKTIGHK